MNKSKSNLEAILVIDSGIGGLSTLIQATQLSNLNYIYFADNKYAPYGKKTTIFLKNRLSQIISSISKKFKILAVVLACNTATTSSIDYLRNTFPKLTIIGTEPAYKIAKDKKFKAPALIATPRTIDSISNKVDKTFKLLPNKTLASLIEKNFINPSPFHNFLLLKEILKIKYSIKSNDCLILGCTHYVFIKSKLSKFINIPLIDGNYGVSKQIFKFFGAKTNKKQSIKIILSNQNSNSLQKYKKILKQILANQIKLC